MGSCCHQMTTQACPEAARGVAQDSPFFSQPTLNCNRLNPHRWAPIGALIRGPGRQGPAPLPLVKGVHTEEGTSCGPRSGLTHCIRNWPTNSSHPATPVESPPPEYAMVPPTRPRLTGGGGGVAIWVLPPDPPPPSTSENSIACRPNTMKREGAQSVNWQVSHEVIRKPPTLPSNTQIG